MSSTPPIRSFGLIATIATLTLPLSVWAEQPPLRFPEELPRLVELDDTGSVRAMLRQGLAVNARDAEGYTPLMLASRAGALKVTQQLISAGADVNARNRFGDSALMLAAFKGHGEVVRALLAAGADLDGPNWSPLIYAAWNGHDAIVTMLLGAGANIGETTGYGTDALMVAAENGHLDTVRQLLEAGADPRRVRDDRATARSLALARGETDAASLLLAGEQRLRTMDQALKEGDTATVVRLVGEGVALEQVDASGNTLLMRAAAAGQARTVARLLDLGARLDARNEEQESALMLALFNGHGEAARLLVARGADLSAGPWHAIHYAVIGGAGGALDAILARGVDVNLPGPHGATALMLAARYGRRNILDQLIDRGANLRQTGEDGRNARGWALLAGNDFVAAHIDRRRLQALLGEWQQALSGQPGAVAQTLAADVCANMPGLANADRQALLDWLAGQGRGTIVFDPQASMTGEPRGSWVVLADGHWQAELAGDGPVQSPVFLSLAVRMGDNGSPQVDAVNLRLPGEPPRWCDEPGR